jgi:hypothetical protein
MCRIKLARRPVAWISLCLMVAVSATRSGAQDYSGSVPTLYVVIDKDYPEALVSPSHAHITAGTNHLALRIPEEWRATVTPALAQIELLSHLSNMKFTVTFLGQSSADAAGLDPYTYSNVVMNVHTGATIRNQFSLGVAGGDGPAFDFDWVLAGGATQCSRTAFIPTAAGVIEFSAVSSPSDRPEMEKLFRTLTGSFWIGTEGRREPPRIRLQGN